MSGTQYIVEIDLRTKGDLSSKVEHSARAASHLTERLHASQQAANMVAGAADRIAGGFEWVAEKAWNVTKYLGAAGMAAGVGAVTWGVTRLNNELEKTTISLGTIFNVQGATSSLQGGLEMASDEIVKMRKDAAALPGEFEDLLGFFRMAAIPAMQAGANPDQVRQISAKAMAASAVAGMNMEQAQREFAMLLGGRSGSHNILGTRLMGLSGDKAQSFNKLDPAARMAALNKELDKYKGAIGVFQGSMDAQWGTTMTNAKTFVQTATKPLFDKVKGALVDINAWFDDNEALVASWSDYLGSNLAAAWDWGRKKIEEWWPLVKNFASVAFDRLEKGWTKIQPAVESVGAVLKDALKDPNGTIDKLITLGKLYLAIKGVGAVAGMAGKAVTTTAGMISIAKAFGVGAAPAAAAAAAPAATSAAGGIAAGELGTAAGGEMAAGALGGAGLVAGALTAAAALAALAGVGAALYEGWGLYTDLTTEGNRTKRAEAEMADRMIEKYRRGEVSFETLQYQVYQFRDAGNEAAASMLDLKLGAEHAAEAMLSIDAKEAKDRNDKLGQEADARALAGGMANAIHALHPENDTGHGAKKKRAPMHGGGGGGTNIQKVEIVVTSNSEPSRVARLVMSEITHLQRNPRSSPHARNFSAARP